MNLIYDDFPETVCIDGKEYEVITDFREWVRFADTAAADELTEEEKLCIFMLYFTKEKPKDFSKALKALIDFYGCADVPKAGRKIGGKSSFSAPVFSYTYDAGYVIAAFRQVYGIDLKSIDYMHWYEFRYLFEAIPDNTAIKERIAYRAVNLSSVKDSRERSRIQKIQNVIALPSNIKDSDIGEIFGGLM